MTTEQHIKLGQQTELVSFLPGTGIFGLYFLASLLKLLFVGCGFTALAGLINIEFLISVL